MANGYDQFFKKARANNTDHPRAKISGDLRAKLHSSSTRKNTGFSLSQEPRDMIVSELRERMKAKQKARSKRRKFPKGLLIFSTLGSFAAGFAYINHEKVETWINKIEVVAMGQAQAKEDAAPAPAEKTAEKSDAKAAEGENKEKRPDWQEDEVNHFQKLVERKKELDAREEELNRMESELQVQRDEIEKRLKSLEDTRQHISSSLKERVVEDEQKVETLVQMYSSMKPAQAAKVLESMDEDLAVEILGRMKKKSAAEVLNLMKAEKAQVFSERYAGYKK